VANLQRANLSDVFGPVDLTGANLSGADLYQTNFTGANLTGANLFEAFLGQANFHKAILTGADLRNSHLEGANLVEATLERARLTGSRVYGVSVWKATFNGAEQSDLVITPKDESVITVDNLQVAQFIYLMTKNQQIREAIDTITSKVVVILGNFSEDRKRVLDAIREELRRLDRIPVLFDWDRPRSKDVTGTVETLARMARFIIADLTDPSSIPHEIATLVPLLRTTPVLPLRLASSKKGYSMFQDYQRSYTWVLETYEYKDGPSLIFALPEIIAPAERMADEFRTR
jgi:hypothetical protein